MTTPHEDALTSLYTLRDWLRYGVSRFHAAGLVYGHGTDNATDEAAFLILATLHLPIHELEPWLDARLTDAEKRAVDSVIEARIATRKPAAYLVNQAWIGPRRFYVDERVIVPRSHIGELLVRGGLEAVMACAEGPGAVLDLCTGSGCLAILAAEAFPDAAIDAADLSPNALDVARINVATYGLQDRIRLVAGDLFTPLSGRRYGLIISNPPYVAAAEMAAFPAEYRAEPAMAHAGGADGLDLVRRILAEADRHLTPEGVLVAEIGTGRERLEQEFSALPFMWLETDTASGEVFALPAAALRPAAPGATVAARKRRA